MEPESAATWAGEIEDPAIRQAAYQAVARVWTHKDRDAARHWMEQHGMDAPEPDAPNTKSPEP
jgi:hypothetical protein